MSRTVLVLPVLLSMGSEQAGLDPPPCLSLAFLQVFIRSLEFEAVSML